MSVILTQPVQRPKSLIERQIAFEQWLWKIKSNFYTQHARVNEAIEKIK